MKTLAHLPHYHFLTEAPRIRDEKGNIEIISVPASDLLSYDPADPFNGNRLTKLEDLAYRTTEWNKRAVLRIVNHSLIT